MTIETRPIETVEPAREKSVADVLRHAARIIEERGWYQGFYSEGLDRSTEDSGPVCALGAIHVAMSGNANPPDGPFPDYESGVLVAAGPFMATDVAFWNDYPGRTAAEVTAALRAAADVWEAEHV